ncbi:MAG TPA: aldolase, partial [Actinomycetes bacterium]|nr:aldolase [Actinomycetes bacterium]
MTSPPPRLGADVLDELDRRLAPADAELAARYPGDAGGRQPVHTVYVPADQMTPRLTAEWGARALTAVATNAPTAAALAAATGIDQGLVDQVLPGVLAKLEAEPVEDLRLDFED